MSDMNVGLFVVTYNISTGLAGAPNLELHLAVNTPQETVNGTSHISQAINPPLALNSSVQGNFTYMTVMPNNSKILVVATGTPSLHLPCGGGIGPVLMPNLDLRMVLEEDWQSGTANFKYSTDGTDWTSITDAKVTKI